MEATNARYSIVYCAKCKMVMKFPHIYEGRFYHKECLPYRRKK